eukprot:5431963-Pyramimonas_sp.AAC.1
MIPEGTLMAMVLASPPRPRCSAASCWEGAIVLVVTLIQACTSQANSRKGTSPARSLWGPVLRASSPPRCTRPTAQLIATQRMPKMVIPIQWPLRSWSDVRGWGLWRVVVNLRGGGGGAMSYRQKSFELE